MKYLQPSMFFALVATLALSAATFAQTGTGTGTGRDTRDQAGQNDRTGTSSGSTMTGQRSGMRGNQEVDQQINEQLSQFAQDPGTAPDKLFVLHNALGNQMEISLAQYAQEHARSDQVKRIAQTIVQDHTQAMQQLQKVAQQVGVQVPQSLPTMKQQELAIFTALPSDEFDKCFISHMQCEHAKDVTKFRNVAQNAKDTNVKQYASAILPTLEKHARQINQAAVAMGMPSSDIGEARTAGERIPRSDIGTGGGTDRTGTGTGTGTGTDRTGTGGGNDRSGGGGGGQ